MPNTFVYPNVLSASERRLVERRERICDAVFQETTHLEWIKVSNIKSATHFSIVKKGLVDTVLASFSEQELVSLSDNLFGDRIAAYDVSDEKARTIDYIKERITDWASRLTALFDNIQSWSVYDWRIIRSTVIQRNEELMQKYSVKPRELPTLSFLKGKHLVGLVPSALWVIGADGRVNITTNLRQYILIDRRQDNGASDWQIVLGNRRTETVAFTKDIFLKLLGES